jgi:hypothetical protein
MNNQNIPGLILPTQKSFVNGAGNPRDSALASMHQMNNSQNNLNQAVGGKRRKCKMIGGGDNTVVVPQFQMLYTPQGGIGTNPNDQIKDTSSIGMQSNSWSKNDNLATKLGGKKNKKGGVKWGCYSGGKKTKKNSKKHTKQIKKMVKNIKKNKKTRKL